MRINKFKEWYKSNSEMIADEIAGEKEYRDASREASTTEDAQDFNEMADDEAKHHDMLVEMEHKTEGHETMKGSKRITLVEQHGGGSYKVLVVGDDKKENWGKINGQVVVDYEARAIAVDAKNDGYSVQFVKSMTEGHETMKGNEILTQVNIGGKLIDITRDNYKQYRHLLTRRIQQELDPKIQYEPKWKSMEEFMKPGETPHSAKWDRCVADVKAEDGSKNAYAICTSQLGEESFKSQYKHTPYAKMQIAKAKKLKMGIEGAGKIPNSLLSEQDLEDTSDMETVKSYSVGDTIKVYPGVEYKIIEIRDGGERYFVKDKSGHTLIVEDSAITKGQGEDLHRRMMVEARRLADNGQEPTYAIHVLVNKFGVSQQEAKNVVENEDRFYFEGKSMTKSTYRQYALIGDRLRYQGRAVVVIDRRDEVGKMVLTVKDVMTGKISNDFAGEFEGVKTSKNAVDTTIKKLDSLVDKAEEAESTETKEKIAEDIKNNQIKSQKATINMRNKSFKEFWKEKASNDVSRYHYTAFDDGGSIIAYGNNLTSEQLQYKVDALKNNKNIISIRYGNTEGMRDNWKRATTK